MALTVEFWVHLEYFAPSQTRDEGAEAELVAILMHGEMGEHMLSIVHGCSPHCTHGFRRLYLSHIYMPIQRRRVS